MIQTPPAMNTASANTLPTVEIPFAQLITRLPNMLMAKSTPIKTRNVSVFTLKNSVSWAHDLSGKTTFNKVETKNVASTPHAMDAVIAWVTPT